MAVTSMRTENRVAFGQMGTYPRSDRFLANVGVASAVDQAALVATRQFLFGLAYDLHRAIQIEDDLASDTAHFQSFRL
jgi:hypothetical protein